MDLSLKKLHHLVTIADAQSFSRAAETLHLSQPALSKSISAIEEAYGFRLFDRSRSGVNVTPAGADVIADARRLLRDARSFDHNARMSAGGERGNVSLGLGPAVASLVLSRLAIGILGHGSGIILHTEIRPIGVLISHLEREEIEVLIAADHTVPIPPEIDHQEIGSVEGGFFVRRGHPLTHKETLTVKDIRHYPMACQDHPDLLKRNLSDLNLLVCDDYGIMHDMMASSDTVCICPRQFSNLSHRNDMQELHFEDWKPRRLPIIAGWIRGRCLSPISRQIIEACKSLLASTEQ